MWEEIGFYEGFALTWKAILSQQLKEDSELAIAFLSLLPHLISCYLSRSSQHIRHLLEYISQFPRVNPSNDDATSLDISKLLSQIRSRYKALCSTLGIQPRLCSSTELEHSDIKHPKDSAIPIWKLDKTGTKKSVTNQDLSF